MGMIVTIESQEEKVRRCLRMEVERERCMPLIIVVIVKDILLPLSNGGFMGKIILSSHMVVGVFKSARTVIPIPPMGANRRTG